MIQYEPLPHAQDVWEGTRICIDKALPSALREQIKWEIVLGYLEFGLQNGIKKYVGIMQNFIWLQGLCSVRLGRRLSGPRKADRRHQDQGRPGRRFGRRPASRQSDDRNPVSRPAKSPRRRLRHRRLRPDPNQARP